MNKYKIDTAENKEFAAFLRNDLLSFGHGFSSPEGGAYPSTSQKTGRPI